MLAYLDFIISAKELESGAYLGENDSDETG
jgi:hypothetical protein